jgi:signal transduction histidine kinase
VTDARSHAKEAPEAVREIIRRAGHELRNALSGVAVNVEVVRSRAGRRGSADAGEQTSFAERASAQVEEASKLTDGLLALVSSVLAAQAAGTLKEPGGHSAGSQIELMIYGDAAAAVVADIERLASRIGVGVEQHGRSVILTILPEEKSHSKD